jgi:hypothetical protein
MLDDRELVTENLLFNNSVKSASTKSHAFFFIITCGCFRISDVSGRIA